MPDRTAQFISTTFDLVLETVAFVFPQPADLPAEAPGEAMLVRLLLSDGAHGEVQLVAGKRFGRLLAANLLGSSREMRPTR